MISGRRSRAPNNRNIRLGSTYNPAFYGLLPSGGSAAGTAHVLDPANHRKLLVNKRIQAVEKARELNLI